MRRNPCVFALIFLCAATAVAQTSDDPAKFRRGEWRSQDVPDGYFVKTVGRYQLQSNCKPELVETIGKHMNAMFKVYSKHFPSTKTPKFNLVIKLFADRTLFRKYGAPPGAGGYYSPNDKEMVGYNTGKVDGEMTSDKGTTGEKKGGFARLRERFTIDTLGVFSHEGWHQYFHWSCGSQVAFPAWADEGIGEYYYPAWMKGEALVMGAPNDYRLPTIQAAIARNAHIPLREIAHYEQSDYYQKADLCYAEGWSWVHFLFEHPNWAQKNYVTKFVAVFKDQHSIGKAMDIVFKGVDWDAMEKDWKAWVMAIPPVSEDGELFEVSDATIARTKKYQAELPENVRKAVLEVASRRKSESNSAATNSKSGSPKSGN